MLDSYVNYVDKLNGNYKETFKQIVGKNTERLCRTLCSEKTVGSRLLFFAELMFSFVILVWIHFIIAVYHMISEGETANFLTYRMSKDITSVLVGCVVCTAIYGFISWKKRKYNG